MNGIVCKGKSGLTEPDLSQNKQIRNWASVKSTDLVQNSRKSPVYLPKMIFEAYDLYITRSSVRALRSPGKDKCTVARGKDTIRYVIQFAIIANAHYLNLF